MTATGIISAYLTILTMLFLGGDPLQPGEAAAELSGRVYEIVASGDHAYAATTAGLTVYDVGKKSRPVEITTLHFPGSGNGLSISDGLAFLSLGPAGLRIIDISEPKKPRVVGFHDTDGSVNAAVAAPSVGSSLVVIADGAMGVKVARFDGEGTVEVVSRLDTGRYARHLAVHGDLVAVADEDDGVGLFRLEPTGMLTELAAVLTPGSARGVAMAPSRCYVAAGLAGVVVLDVSSPARAGVVATFPTDEYARGLTVKNGIVYVADSGAGLRIFQEDGRAIGAWETTGIANRVSLSGDTAFVAADGSGIDLVNVSRPEKPRGY